VSAGARFALARRVRVAHLAYETLAPLYDAVCGWSLHAGRRRAIALLKPRPGETILEVGVGTGYGVNDYPRGCKVVAIDLSRPMIERAARRVDHDHRGVIAFAQMDAGNLALPNHAFDAVYVPHTINVVPDPIAVGKELLRVCAPAGRIVFLNHFDDVPETTNLINGLVGRIASGFDVNWHLRIETLAKALKLRVAAIESVNTPRLSSVVLCERLG
jgi:ubiquinone/menaquinone biosynthesis C-methylase UbiE